MAKIISSKETYQIILDELVGKKIRVWKSKIEHYYEVKPQDTECKILEINGLRVNDIKDYTITLFLDDNGDWGRANIKLTSLLQLAV